jgi:hypothetical protein
MTQEMSDYQMVAYADHLHIDVIKIYPDVRLRKEKGIPIVEIAE